MSSFENKYMVFFERGNKEFAVERIAESFEKLIINVLTIEERKNWTKIYDLGLSEEIINNH